MTAEEIDQRTGQAAGWTSQHTGVEFRYECRSPESVLTMGMKAIQAAMAQARISWSQVDLIVDCSTSRYRPIPCNAAHYQQLIGSEAQGIPCFDIQTTCLGFLVALNTINALMGSDMYRHVVVVASEAAMLGVNWQQPESAGLIGDGAAAAVLQKTEPGGPLLMAHETWAEHLDTCKVDGGAHFIPAFHYVPDRHQEFVFDMNGPGVFRVAMSRLPRMVRALQQQWNALPDSQMHAACDLPIIPHQASPGALEIVRQMLKRPCDRFHCAAAEIGNMAAASLPFMLDRCLKSGTVTASEPVMLLGTSAGYSQAAMILTPGGTAACS